MIYITSRYNTMKLDTTNKQFLIENNTYARNICWEVSEWNILFNILAMLSNPQLIIKAMVILSSLVSSYNASF